MSFPKAKLKRFNDIPAVSSPFCDKKEKSKGSGGSSTKDEKVNERCVDKIEKVINFDKLVDKLSTKSHSTEKDSAKSSKYRLFRTPSLPRRLRFRNTDSSSTTKAVAAAAEAAEIIAKAELELKEKEAFQSALVEIQNKTETLKENGILIEELKNKIHELNETLEKINTAKDVLLLEKNNRIEHLSREIESLNEADEVIKKNAENSLDKIEELKREMTKIVSDSETVVTNLNVAKTKLENNVEYLSSELKLSHDMNINLKEKFDNLIEEVISLKSNLQLNEKEIHDHKNQITDLLKENGELLQKIENLNKQNQESLIDYATESKNMIDKIESLEKLKDELHKNLLEDKENIIQLTNQIKELEVSNQNLIKKYEYQISNINEVHDIKIKEMESIFYLEKSMLIKETHELKADIDLNHKQQIEKLNEVNEEKIRISEIQFEGKIKALESSYESTIEKERRFWQTELNKCQKIAESEIIQSEFEKRDLKELLDVANELVRDKDNQIEQLEHKIKNSIENEFNSHETCRLELEESQRECKRILTEKYNYQLTLNNTRSTVGILMERLKKSDTDVELLKTDIEIMSNIKKEYELKCDKLQEEAVTLRNELQEYKTTLSALRHSSANLEFEMKHQENVFEKLMMSEQETLQTIDQIGKIFDAKIDENITKYLDMYNELKKKYEHRESYIKDMKLLLDEFVTGIEIARIEIDAKNKQLIELELENKSIKLENMTYRFKCEQYERYDSGERNQIRIHNNTPDIPEINDGENVPYNNIIDNIINDLDKDDLLNDENYLRSTKKNDDILDKFKFKSRNDKLDSIEKNSLLSSNFTTKSTEKYAQLIDSQNALREKITNIENLKENNSLLQSKILQLNSINKEKDDTITELKEKLTLKERTPKKTLTTLNNSGTPKTPKTPKTPIKMFAGKENRSPAMHAKVSSPLGVLRPRNH